MDRLGSEIWLGATNIRAGIREARIHFEANGTENVEKIIVCLTDGVHNVDEGPMAEAELCKAQGIKIHTITFSERADKEGMTAIADATGGSQSHADDAETLALIFKRLGGAFAILTK
jgi:Mg-chelatase subunit ChlD